MKFIPYIFIIAFLYGCANRLPLTGGPEDKTPPVIINFSPAQRTTNFEEDEILIEFSKYMNKIQVEEDVFFSPSVEYEADWSGKELQIEFNQDLEPNTTYALMLGTDHTDIRGNKPAEQFSLVFSTGSIIDTGMITGRLYDDDPSGCFIYAYRIDDLDLDTFKISDRTPQYRSQIGTSGNFSIPALKDGTYRLFSMRDKYSNDIYDEEVDDFGAPSQDFEVVNGTSDFVHIKIGPPIDKTGPIIFDCLAKTKRLIFVNFSEPLDTNSINTSTIILLDSATKSQVDVLDAYLSPLSPTAVELVLKQDVDTNSVFICVVPTDISPMLTDTLGNAIQDTANTFSFSLYPEDERITPKLIAVPFADSTLSIHPDSEFRFTFNTAISNDIIGKVKIMDMEDSSYIDTKRILKGNILSIKPNEQLSSDKWYSLKLEQAGITGLNGIAPEDSTVSLRFKTMDLRSYGSVSGRISNPEDTCSYLIILRSKITRQNVFKEVANELYEWNFPQVPPETYTIEVVCDHDGNGRYSYGYDVPFSFSEKFYMLKEEIVVQPRWEVEDVVLILPDKDW
jgi:uncharacterized protein (DUF2141 family)